MLVGGLLDDLIESDLEVLVLLDHDFSQPVGVLCDGCDDILCLVQCCSILLSDQRFLRDLLLKLDRLSIEIIDLSLKHLQAILFIVDNGLDLISFLANGVCFVDGVLKTGCGMIYLEVVHGGLVYDLNGVLFSPICNKCLGAQVVINIIYVFVFTMLVQIWVVSRVVLPIKGFKLRKC